MTRKRIRYRFRKFIQQFSECKAAVCNLKLKYLMSLEMLLPSLYSERFQVTDRQARQVTIVVTGNSGIQCSKGPEEGAEEVRSLVECGRWGELLLLRRRRRLHAACPRCCRSCRPSATSQR